MVLDRNITRQEEAALEASESKVDAEKTAKESAILESDVPGSKENNTIPAVSVNAQASAVSQPQKKRGRGKSPKF